MSSFFPFLFCISSFHLFCGVTLRDTNEKTGQSKTQTADCCFHCKKLSHDVTKFKPRNYRFFWVSTFVRYCSTCKSLFTQIFGSKGFFVLDRGRLNFQAFAWRGICGLESSCVGENVTDFLRFCFLNIPCLKINVALIFMSSSSDEFTYNKENSETDVSVGSRRPYLCPSKGHQHGVSIQSLIKSGKRFFRMFRIWNIARI